MAERTDIMQDYSSLSPAELRAKFRTGELVLPTAGLCPGYIQGNLVILHRRYGEDFLQFMKQNPKPCPILEVFDQGSPISHKMAEGADITTDIPLYRIYRNGVFEEEVKDVSGYWNEDMVGFLIGCSLTFESRLVEAGIPLKHYEENKRVPMFDTNIACKPSKLFHGNYVVSMRPVKKELVDLAVKITEPMDYAHGAPVQIGDPDAIGIKDVLHPDYGDPLDIGPDEVPDFWACGVTPQNVATQAKPDLLISHSPGYMLISDIDSSKL